MVSAWSDPAEKGGHGAMGYNQSYKDLGEFWSRSGLFAIACHLRGERSDMRDALTKVMRERHPWIRNSHAYGEPGGALGLLALQLAKPDAFVDVLGGYGWWMRLAWEPGYGLRFTMPHMGAPYMGTDDLINAAYALVLASPKMAIHLTGGTKRGWLDVSQLETAASPVQIKRGSDGQLRLAATVPGPDIRFTTDGSEPDAESPLFREPVDFSSGGIVKARAYPKTGEPGPVAEVDLPPAKGNWKIAAASGHADPAEAIARAAYAIDESDSHAWFTDVGEGATGYPHHIVIDLGESRHFSTITLHLKHQAAAPGGVEIFAGDDPDQLAPAGKAEWADFKPRRDIPLNAPKKARFLKIVAPKPSKEQSIGLIIDEIDAR
jgi:hypothetical protein